MSRLPLLPVPGIPLTTLPRAAAKESEMKRAVWTLALLVAVPMTLLGVAPTQAATSATARMAITQPRMTRISRRSLDTFGRSTTGDWKDLRGNSIVMGGRTTKFRPTRTHGGGGTL